MERKEIKELVSTFQSFLIASEYILKVFEASGIQHMVLLSVFSYCFQNARLLDSLVISLMSAFFQSFLIASL